MNSAWDTLVSVLPAHGASAAACANALAVAYDTAGAAANGDAGLCVYVRRCMGQTTAEGKLLTLISIKSNAQTQANKNNVKKSENK